MGLSPHSPDPRTVGTIKEIVAAMAQDPRRWSWPGADAAVLLAARSQLRGAQVTTAAFTRHTTVTDLDLPRGSTSSPPVTTTGWC